MIDAVQVQCSRARLLGVHRVGIGGEEDGQLNLVEIQDGFAFGVLNIGMESLNHSIRTELVE